MAAALLAHHGGDRVHVRSAGSLPTASIDPAVVEAMAEIGIEITDEFPKPLTDDVVRAADVVVTMGCGNACPIYPGKRYLDWQVRDPAGLSPGEVRAIRTRSTSACALCLPSCSPPEPRRDRPTTPK